MPISRAFLPWRLSDAGPDASRRVRARARIRNLSGPPGRPAGNQRTLDSYQRKVTERTANCSLSLTMRIMRRLPQSVCPGLCAITSTTATSAPQSSRKTFGEPC